MGQILAQRWLPAQVSATAALLLQGAEAVNNAEAEIAAPNPLADLPAKSEEGFGLQRLAAASPRSRAGLGCLSGESCNNRNALLRAQPPDPAGCSGSLDLSRTVSALNPGVKGKNVPFVTERVPIQGAT